MEHQNETGCQAPEAPILCINNCGFFGSASTMNMCSKCHRDLVLKQEQANLAASSIDSIVNGTGSKTIHNVPDTPISIVEPKAISLQTPDSSSSSSSSIIKPEPNPVVGPTRCNACKKRLGLTGFNCRCGSMFCAAHRYSDKHGCSFDYKMAGRDAIAKANPVVKGEKLDKI